MSTAPNGSGAPELTRFRQLAHRYWLGSGNWRARLLAAATVALSFAHVLLQLRLNLWLGEFFNTLEARDHAKAAELVIAFVLIAAATVVVGALQIQSRMAAQIDLRRWLAGDLIARWLTVGRHYVVQFEAPPPSNPDQRIAEDVQVVAEATIDFGIGLLQSVLLLASFVGVLWTVSGTLVVAGMAIPGHLVFVAVAYAGIGFTLTHLTGRDMPAIHERRRAQEGELRARLARVHENSEGIAFLGGDANERGALALSLDALIAAWRRLIRRQRMVTLVATGYTIAAPVVPLLVAIPSYFAGDMTIGGLIQASAAFVQIQLALGFFVDNYARISDWRAALNRVLALGRDLAHVAAVYAPTPERGIVVGESEGGSVRFVGVHLDGPDGLVVIEQADAEIAPGEKVLVIGESGAGKTTLVRAAAGLWPWGRGRIELPRGARLAFMAERPYFPHGTLRAALAYPEPPERFATQALRVALARCDLEPLAERLDEAARWDQALTIGEQQQLGFARLLLHRPDCVFMDEATTALDAATLERRMAIFRNELAAATLISVDHRPGLDAFHDRSLALVRLLPAGDAGDRARNHASVVMTAAPDPGLRAALRRLLRFRRR